MTGNGMSEMQFSLDYVDLAQWRLAGHGASRNIFENRMHPDVVIKTVKPSAQSAGGNRKVKSKLLFFKKWRRFGAYMVFRRELEEYLNLARKFAGEEKRLPIAKIFGFVQTSQGLGMIVERVSSRDGSLAPTLRRLIEERRFEQNHLDGLNEFFSEAQRLHIVLMDCNLGNFVWCDGGGSNPRVVCVDGTGEKSPVGMYAMSGVLNRIKLKRYRARLHRQIWKHGEAAGINVSSLVGMSV
ncbi:YrbL family protein [Aliirhizobium cellulosilyticum]|uniref:PhoP regulatory network protein YrbL n=1 Tax=Aliirhizobium cellulosilyticum TaxID=393664 RepID=A0A7W6S6E6_9HYPH|nr:YrbL family protein [Rhizobium cellulosilyticum]MBB4347924.1 hypothetical protein [Rhizobium cellulosilyticum]MBB4409682.1 hypothetical protein [Rhizobium cellulosilyticum]MBB4444369.1 hypothetical protein [Rhizobium cellulosilyticum]